MVGLSYMRGRWYDPAVGRFVQEDPLGVDGGINLYTFSGDDPVNGSDPDGTCPTDQIRYETNADSWILTCGPHGGILATGPLSGSLTPMIISANPNPTRPNDGGLPPLPPPPSPNGPDGTNATSYVSQSTNNGSLTAPTALDYKLDRWRQCALDAWSENWRSLTLDAAGWVVVGFVPEGAVAGTVAGSLLGVGGLGLAVVDHNGAADGVASGSLAVAGHYSALAEAAFQGAASATAHSVSLNVLVASTGYDLYKFGRKFSTCNSGH